MPQFLYFDVGNVLLAFDHDRMIRQLAAVAGVDEDTVRQALMAPIDGGPTAQQRFESGLWNQEEIHDHFCQVVGVRPDRERLFHAACDIFEAMPESMALVERLAAAGNRLGLLSNTNAADYAFYMNGQFPQLNRCFELAVLSFEVGAMKPDAAIYLAAAQRAEVPAGQVFFVDDKPENVAGARAAGLDAVLFSGHEPLLEELRRREVPGV
jgi:putative hydrolase of the HAD superfamily